MHLHTVVHNDGTTKFIDRSNPFLFGLFTAYDVSPGYLGENGFSEMMAVVAGNAGIYLAVNDLVQAISDPYYSCVSCARAMDGIRHVMSPPGTAKEDGWKIVHAMLRVEPEYLKYISKHSRSFRHGDPTPNSNFSNEETAKRSWIVMNRFLEFRKKRSNQSASRERVFDPGKLNLPSYAAIMDFHTPAASSSLALPTGFQHLLSGIARNQYEFFPLLCHDSSHHGVSRYIARPQIAKGQR